ncbi:conserved Plasmodium protein, unknown function [Plasmodium relictum]|uniref:Uncharacterized protein n=1 Tax=Plasmodium relictum TaxID=85471 RepID=A0A1J1H1N9_PLARL|nr:conserved Plasmodium protein, unknown function [Plasmodium relictum]CRG98842.1 conserved Plasmodium protein, unknown function [Plasmodium relictum]
MSFFSEESNNSLTNEHEKTKRKSFQNNFNFSFDENFHKNKYGIENCNENEHFSFDFEDIELHKLNNLKEKNHNKSEKKSSLLTPEKINKENDFISNNNAEDIIKRETNSNFEEFDENNDDFFKIDHENFFNYNFTNSYNTEKKNEGYSKSNNQNKICNLMNEENDLSILKDLYSISKYKYGKSYENNLNNDYLNKNNINKCMHTPSYSDHPESIKDNLTSNVILLQNSNIEPVHLKSRLTCFEKDVFGEFKPTENLRKNEIKIEEKKNLYNTEMEYIEPEKSKINDIEIKKYSSFLNLQKKKLHENIYKITDYDIYSNSERNDEYQNDSFYFICHTENEEQKREKLKEKFNNDNGYKDMNILNYNSNKYSHYTDISINKEKENKVSFENKEIYEVNDIKEKRKNEIHFEGILFENRSIQKNKDKKQYEDILFKNEAIGKVKNKIIKGNDEKIFGNSPYEIKEIEKKEKKIEKCKNKNFSGRYLYEKKKIEDAMVNNEIKKCKSFFENKNVEKLKSEIERNDEKKIFDNFLCENKEIKKIEQKTEKDNVNELLKKNCVENEKVYVVENIIEKEEDENIVEKGEDENIVEKEEDENIVEKGEDENIVEKEEDENIVEKEEDENIVEKVEDESIVEKGEDGSIIEKGEDENIVEKEEDENIVEKEEDENIVEKGEDGSIVEKGEDESIVEKGEDESIVEKGEDGSIIEKREDENIVEKVEDENAFENDLFENKKREIDIDNEFEKNFKKNEKTYEIEIKLENTEDENIFKNDLFKNKYIEKDDKEIFEKIIFENEQTYEIESTVEKSENKYHENEIIEKDNDKKLLEKSFTGNEKIYEVENIIEKGKYKKNFENDLFKDKKVKEFKFDKLHKIRNIDEMENIIENNEDIKLFKRILFENKEMMGKINKKFEKKKLHKSIKKKEFKINKLFKNKKFKKKIICMSNVKNAYKFINDNKMDSSLLFGYLNPKKNTRIDNISLENVKKKNLDGGYIEVNFTSFLNHSEENFKKNHEISKNSIKGNLSTILKKKNEINTNEKKELLNKQNACSDYKNNFNLDKKPNLRKNKNKFIENIQEHKLIGEYNEIVEEVKVCNIITHENYFMSDKKESNFNKDIIKSKINISDKIKKKKKNFNRFPFSVVKQFEYGLNSIKYIKALKCLPPLEFLKCKELRPYLHLFNIVLKIVYLNCMEEDYMYILMGDETGCIYLKLNIKYKEICKKNQTVMLVNSSVVVEDGHIVLEINEYSNIFLLKYNIIKNVNISLNFSEMKFVTLS